MFKIKPDPTFDASVTIVGQGREQKLECTFNHMSRSEYTAMLEAMAKGELETADALLKVVHSWNADGDLTRENVQALCDLQPGADWAIITGYGDALTVARKGN